MKQYCRRVGILFLFSLFVLVSVFSGASRADDWVWQNPLPIGEDLQAVWGSSASDIYAVGVSGAVVHYNGSSWSIVETGVYANFTNVWGSSSSDVFLIGNSGVIVHYNGTAWSTMTSGTTQHLYGIWGSSGTDVFVVGYGTAIYHYNGTSWSSMSTPIANASYLGVWGTSSSDVYAVGVTGTILHYNGSNWSSMTSNTTKTLLDVWGTSSSDIFAVGYSGTILHYNGSAWSTMTSGTTQGLQCVWGSSGSDVYAVGSNGTAVHYNGSSWASFDPETSTSLQGVWGFSSANVYTVGYNGHISWYNGTSWARVTTGSPEDIYDVWVSSGNSAFAVGRNGTILHYDGSDWTAMVSGTTQQLNSVWGTSSADVFAVGAEGTILHYNGSAWTPMTSGTPNFLSGIWGTGSSNVYVVGSSGTILHYNGSTWSPMTSGTSTHLLGIWGSTKADIFAVGYYVSPPSTLSTIVHFDGSGWSTMISGTTPGLYDVWGRTGSDVFAVGTSGTVLHYDGNGWAAQTSGSTQNLRSIWGINGSHVFVGGYNRALIQYNGSTWSDVDTSGMFKFEGVGGKDNHVFAVGSDGSIKYLDDPYVPPSVSCYVDSDQDGYGTSSTVTATDGTCDTAENESYYDTDCNDSDPLIHPGAPEVVNDGVDQNCDNGELCYADADDDGYRPDSFSTVQSADMDCSDFAEAIGSDPTGDCDDANPAAYPGATEVVADGVDQSCDSQELCYLDADDDGYRPDSSSTTQSADMDCSDFAEAIGSDPTGDCDDANPAAYPGATEVVADGIDQSCDSQELCYLDADDDGYRPDSSSTTPSTDMDCSDFAEATGSDPTGDCDDANPAAYPGATEVVADGIDQSCDGQELCYTDADDDGYRPDSSSTTQSADMDCSDVGEATGSDPTGDCDDTNLAVSPGATEVVADGVDQSCDGQELCYADADDDGYRPDSSSTVTSNDLDCLDAAEAVPGDPIGDCNDSDPGTYPGASELVGDSVDQDCDGGEICYQDSDADSYGTSVTLISADSDCSDLNESAVSTDCDDANDLINPGVKEICDEIDNNCNTYIDEYGVCSKGFWLLVLPSILNSALP